jgi:Ser/Thr protein kinase RdoA (MazF antagonist)
MGSVIDDAARDLLRTVWGLGDVRLEPLLAGHTNSSYLVHAGHGTFIARISWPGKTAAQVDRERQAIGLARGKVGDVVVPTIIPTRQGTDYVRTTDGRWLHVFKCIDGTSGMPSDSGHATGHAMRALAALHAALSPMPITNSDPLTWLSVRYERVRARPTPLLASIRSAEYTVMLEYLGALLTATTVWVRGPVQWLHGDFHAGNILFAGHRVSGVVDFDEVGQGAAWLEAAFAAFALSRDTDNDDGFRFDASRWQQAVMAYASAIPGADANWWLGHRDTLLNLFCLDQILIHIEAAQRGLWEPGPGMGFLGCWRTLSDQCDRNASHRSMASTVASRSSARGEASCRHSTASSPRPI